MIFLQWACFCLLLSFVCSCLVAVRSPLEEEEAAPQHQVSSVQYVNALISHMLSPCAACCEGSCPTIVNTHFGQLLEWAPSGLCCPARRATIYRSVSQPVGIALLQDSQDSFAVFASITGAALSSSAVVQMRMTLNSNNDTLTSVLLASSLTPPYAPFSLPPLVNLSSLSNYPVGSLTTTVGTAVKLLFFEQLISSATDLSAALYGVPQTPPLYWATFPARVSY